MPVIGTFIKTLVAGLIGNWKPLAVAVAVGAVGGWKAAGLWDAHTIARELRAENKTLVRAAEKRDVGDTLRFARGMALEQALDNLRVDSNLIESAREYAKPAYTDCALPVDGLRYLQKAARAVNATRMR